MCLTTRPWAGALLQACCDTLSSPTVYCIYSPPALFEHAALMVCPRCMCCMRNYCLRSSRHRQHCCAHALLRVSNPSQAMASCLSFASRAQYARALLRVSNPSQAVASCLGFACRARYAHSMRVFVFNSGLFYIRPTPAALDLLDRLVARVESENGWDQAIFNEASAGCLVLACHCLLAFDRQASNHHV